MPGPHKIPAHAYSDYVALGSGRKLSDLAKKYKCSVRAISKVAQKEDWYSRIGVVETNARARYDEDFTKQIVNQRRADLKTCDLIEGKALRALETLEFVNTDQVVKALTLVFTHRSRIFGEPTHRLEMKSTETVIREEIRSFITIDGETPNVVEGTYDANTTKPDAEN